MMNVLVVDDQKHIRDGLETMLRRFPLELNEIYCAASGTEALHLLREKPVQLVITDIRMPDMDGLTLMERTREERIAVEYLIISGYSDFVYAQKAIALGAKGYLLKPVKREDLQHSVEHVMQEVHTRQTLSRNLEQLSRRAQEADRKELRMFMQGAESEASWIDETERLNPELWRSYRLCLLREELWINRPGAVSVHTAESIAYRIYGSKKCMLLQRHPHLILAVGEDEDPGVFHAALKAEQLAATMVTTDPQQGLKRLPETYNQLMELYQHSYLFPERDRIEPKHMKGLEQQWQLPYEQIDALFRCIGTDNSGKMAESVSLLFKKTVLQRYPIRYTLHLCQAMVQMLEENERVIRPYMGEEKIDIDCLRNLFDYPSIREYIQALLQQLLRLNQFYYEMKCSYRNTHDLNEAIRYIHENYDKPLDLAMVSNHVSLNYSYFSNLFKKSIGKGFAEYLRDVRMEKARKLLAETDYKVTEVAAMVGYENYKSFARGFREVMNMQPTEYRELMRRKKTDES